MERTCVLSEKFSPYINSLPRPSFLPSWDTSSRILGDIEFSTHGSGFLLLSSAGGGRTGCKIQQLKKKKKVWLVLRWSHTLCYTCYCQDLQIFVWSGSTGFRATRTELLSHSSPFLPSLLLLHPCCFPVLPGFRVRHITFYYSVKTLGWPWR